jgi:calcium binding protein
MPKADKSDPVREQRILMEVVVDAYGADERAMGWYCYLEGKLNFPFTAPVHDQAGGLAAADQRPGRGDRHGA